MLKTLIHTASVHADVLRLTASHAGGAPHPHRGSRHMGLVSWYLPPHTNAGTFRPASWLRYAHAFGWRVTAVGSAVPAAERAIGAELLAKVHPSHHLIEFQRSGRSPSWRLTPEVDGGFVNAVDLANAMVRALGDEPPDVVVATGPPFCTFIAGYIAARHWRRPLVLDYRDEWTLCPFDFVSKGRSDRHWEVKSLRQAATVLYTTDSMRQHAIDQFPEVDLARKSAVVANGTEVDDFQPAWSQPPGAASMPFELVHVGALAGHTPPNTFLQVLTDGMARGIDPLDRLRVKFVGRRSREADAALDSTPCRHAITLVEQVSKREAIRHMQSAQALLLIADKDLERYMPSKLFDYVAAGRPILVFGHEGEAASAVQKLGVGVRCDPATGAAGLASALQLLCRIDLQSRASAVDAWLRQHRRDQLAKQFFDTLAQALPA